MNKSELDKIIDEQVQEVKDARARLEVALSELSKSVKKIKRSETIKRGIEASRRQKLEE